MCDVTVCDATICAVAMALQVGDTFEVEPCEPRSNLHGMRGDGWGSWGGMAGPAGGWKTHLAWHPGALRTSRYGLMMQGGVGTHGMVDTP